LGLIHDAYVELLLDSLGVEIRELVHHELVVFDLSHQGGWMIVLRTTIQAELIRGILVITIMILVKLIVREAFHVLWNLSVLNRLVMANFYNNNLVLLLAYSKLLRQITLLHILLTSLLSRLIAAI
jgi:hypothetical protein